MEKGDLKEGFDSILGVETIIKRRQRNKQNNKKNHFISIIKKYEYALTKSFLLSTQYSIDLSEYEDPFYNIIDELILLSWGEEVYRITTFYFYERINPDGTENYLYDETGEVELSTPELLYDYLIKKFPNIFSK